MVDPAPTHPCRPGFVDAVLCSATRKIVSLAHTLIAAGAGALRWIYLSTLGYGVDANMGGSVTARGTNSCCRGVLGFVAVEAAVSLQLRHRGTRPLTHSRAPRGGRTIKGTGGCTRCGRG